MTLVDLVNLLRIWAIALAITFTLACATLRQADGDYLLLLSGIASGLFARALLSSTAADTVVISTWMGLYGLTLGILFLKLALYLHSARSARFCSADSSGRDHRLD
jgi:uncharacterized membrane protein HdeD (DUF308 family)